MTGLTIAPGEALTEARLGALLAAHERAMRPKRRLREDYLGLSPVHKGRVARGRPNNEAYTALGRYIVNTATGYLVGVPPVYVYDDGDAAARLSEVLDANDETTVNYALAEDMAMVGWGMDLVWFDETGAVRLRELDPLDAFLVRTADLAGEARYGVRLYREARADGVVVTRGEVYSPKDVQPFSYDGAARFTGDPQPHHLDGVPMTEYPNNRFNQGDFEPVRRDIDAYNLALSCAADDLQSVANAFLALVGMGATDEAAIEEANRTRVLLLPEGGAAQFITKEVADSALQHHKADLRRDILQVAGVPDLSDEFFSGNASGVALRYKLWGLDQLWARKKSYMERSLFRRLRLIAGALNLKGARIGEVSRLVTIKWTRNMPQDVSEKVTAAQALSGIASNQTVYEALEPVTGVTAADEAARVAAEELAPVEDVPVRRQRRSDGDEVQ